MIDEKIAERRASVRDDRRRARLRRTVTFVVVLAVVGVLVAVERSALVGLEEVEVVGIERLTPDEVREAAALELGTSTLRLRLDRASEQVEGLPLVRRAEAGRLDPLTVQIVVEERAPQVVAVGGDERRLLDAEGVVIDDVDPTGDEDLLETLAEIHLPGAPPAVGERVAADPALANAHAAWRGLSGPIRAEVVRLDAAGPDELTLRLRAGIAVRFGRAERIDEKVRALGAVLEDIGDTPIEMIDVRAPRAPVVGSG
ncbi:MAG: FtsQ-type POTRA domain-containing protein [Nitriliruptoraceae bacterium]